MAERDDEGFLARWSRRKQAAREAEREPEQDTPPAPMGAADPAEQAQEADRPALPDPATLDASSDFSVFLGRDVPLETHRAALRRLWRLDPIYNRIDGLDDYCEDYTDKAKVVKGLRTAYKVGRGMLEQVGAGEAPPDKAPPAEQPRDEPQRLAASDDPVATPPDTPAPRSDPPPQPTQRSARRQEGTESARAPARPRPRPLPKRG